MVRSWRRAPQVSLAGRRVPLNVLVSPWWQPPQDCLAPGRLGTLKTAVAEAVWVGSLWLVAVMVTAWLAVTAAGAE